MATGGKSLLCVHIHTHTHNTPGDCSFHECTHSDPSGTRLEPWPPYPSPGHSLCRHRVTISITNISTYMPPPHFAHHHCLCCFVICILSCEEEVITWLIDFWWDEPKRLVYALFIAYGSVVCCHHNCHLVLSAFGALLYTQNLRKETISKWLTSRSQCHTHTHAHQRIHEKCHSMSSNNNTDTLN